jgi:menaquinone-dependent protoporphyrinogen oxidase
MTVLVAYGTSNGSTAGIAEMIAATLRAEGISTQVEPAGLVRDVGTYEAVILGGALYAGRWHRDARSFARRHRKALAGRPVWLFSSGPLDNSADAGAVPPVAQVVQAGQRLHAAGHITFGGRLTEEAGGFVARAMVRNGKGGDFRNPEQIAGWAQTIAHQLTDRAAS